MQKRLVFELKNIKKEYHNRTVLQIKHLQCHPGTIYGIIGPIGAGKTTLLKILSGRIKPSKGELRFEGEEFQANWLGKKSSAGKVLDNKVIEPDFLTYKGSLSDVNDIPNDVLDSISISFCSSSKYL